MEQKDSRNDGLSIQHRLNKSNVKRGTNGQRDSRETGKYEIWLTAAEKENVAVKSDGDRKQKNRKMEKREGKRFHREGINAPKAERGRIGGVL